MTDDPAEESLDPRAEAALRRALADARHTDPAPVDVAARLDDVLARLRDGEPSAPIVDLEARRRRRTATRLLAAAAAVIVVGGVGARVFGPGPSGSDAASSSQVESGSSGTDGDPQRDAVGGASAQVAAPPTDPDGAVPQSSEAQDYSGASGSLTRLSSIPELTEAGFVRQVAQLQPSVRQAARSTRALSLDAGVNAACGPGAYGEGTAVLVDYDGDPAVLVFRPASGQTQIVDLLQCGSAEVVRSTTLQRD